MKIIRLSVVKLSVITTIVAALFLTVIVEKWERGLCVCVFVCLCVCVFVCVCVCVCVCVLCVLRLEIKVLLSIEN
jgi:hypothetical protein